MLADTNAVAVATGRKPATIRSWAHRGHLTRHGTDPRGRALYDLDQALRHANVQPVLDSQPGPCNTQSAAVPSRPGADECGSTA